MDHFRLFIIVGLVSMFIQDIRGALDAPKLLAIASECKTIEKATELDFINLKMNVRPKTRTMKCLTACLFEKVGKLTNKQFDTQDVIRVVQQSPKISNKLRKPVTEVINECAEIRHPDRCENASKIVDCLIDGAAKRGIKSKRI